MPCQTEHVTGSVTAGMMLACAMAITSQASGRTRRFQRELPAGESRRCSSRRAAHRLQPVDNAVRQRDQIAGLAVQARLSLLAMRGRAYRLFDLNFSP